ncbi:hypothetical protein [Rubidibacter lacunae]|uniref:hypothetical protein n=1 Tax=Rubidibacter lacunae TaxID=582514 RepID=UPI00040DCD90|nr:hypothetical protein [Rubidibacter lacunae]
MSTQSASSESGRAAGSLLGRKRRVEQSSLRNPLVFAGSVVRRKGCGVPRVEGKRVLRDRA